MSEATVVDKRWTYCPECGSTEIRHAEGDHKQCACCLQEWFADIDYFDIACERVAYVQNQGRLFA